MRHLPPVIKWRVAVPLLCALGLAPGQTPPRMTFEVATIKPSGPLPPPEVRNTIRIQRGPEYFFYPRISPFALILMAYGLDNSQVVVPDWTKDLYFDITAKATEPATPEQTAIMLQNLLADRFHLVFHRETKVLPVYELTIANSGLKMVESVAGRVDPRAAPLPEQKEGGSLWIAPGKGPMASYTRSTDGVTLASGRGARLSDVVFFLDRRLRAFDSQRQLLDRTGLTGTYDFGIQFLDPNSEIRPRPGTATDLPGIFKATEEYLGLKIEAANRPMDVLVVDSADRNPSDN